MEQRNAEHILLKYRSGTATEEERAFIEDWAVYGTHNTPQLTNEQLLNDLADIRQRLKIDGHKTTTARLWPRIAAAASVLIFLLAGSYCLLLQKHTSSNKLPDIGPGSDKAILTLSNGSRVNLTSAKPGQIASQGQTVIDKTAPGIVVYHASHNNANGQTAYNTITIPKAGKWHVVLPDGSKAWLDAFSSIRFPTSFNSNNRTVEISGQVYFEVVHNAASPFRVTANGQTVEDIGTKFNISAYPDEPALKTTLLEGSVKVIKGNNHIILKPGERSVLFINNNNIQVEKTVKDNDIAWKEGYFEFNKASIQTVMRQFSRWYDVDVEYEGQVPVTMITGRVHRDVNLSEALKILSYMDIHFKIAHKKIIITP